LSRNNQITLAIAKPEKPKPGLVTWLPLVTVAASLFVTMATCFLYASHKASTDAYFNAFSVPTGVFEPQMQEILYSGGIAGLPGFFVLAAALFFAGPGFFLSAWLGAWITSRFSFPRAKDFATKIALRTGMNEIDRSAIGLSAIIYGVGAIGVVLTVILPIPLVLVERQARERAEEQIEAIKTNNAAGLRKHRLSNATIVVEEDGKPVTYVGRRIYCRMGKACVLRNANTTVIVPLEKLHLLNLEDAPSP
jgi:hypothetical protein